MGIDIVMDQAFSVCPSLFIVFRILGNRYLIVDYLDVIVSEFLCRLNFRFSVR